MRRLGILLVLAFAAGVEPLSSQTHLPPEEVQRLEALARTVTIHRDTYGVPHVHGPTDAAVIFGSTYARLEDRFHELEPRIIESLGREAELRGEEGVLNDVFIRAIELDRLARAEYADASPRVRAIAEAFADGYNYFLHRNPRVEPLLIERFEPWMVFASYRISMGVTPEGVGIAPEELLDAIPRQKDGPSRSPAATSPASPATSTRAATTSPRRSGGPPRTRSITRPRTRRICRCLWWSALAPDEIPGS